MLKLASKPHFQPLGCGLMQEVIRQDVAHTLRHTPTYLNHSLMKWIGPRTGYLQANGHRLPPVAHYIEWPEDVFCDYVACPLEDFHLFGAEWQTSGGAFWASPDPFL